MRSARLRIAFVCFDFTKAEFELFRCIVMKTKTIRKQERYIDGHILHRLADDI